MTEKIMNSSEIKTKSKFKKIILSAVSALLFVCVLLISFGKDIGIPTWNNIFSLCGIYADLGDDLSLSFINVGSADACYITCHGKNILIDAGESADFNKISAYLKRNGCTHFDALIVSHPDSDHIGGMSDVIENFGADEVYINNLPKELVPDTDEYKNFVNSVKENKVKCIDPKAVSKFAVGDLKFDFISPTKTYDNVNDSSLVVKMTYKENSFLFTGDISYKVEEDLINSNIELKADVLKVAHHGSKTSSSQQFLEAVSPQISVVSVGSNDRALPDYNTMARINACSNELYRTDKDKTVVITSDGKNLSVQTHA